MIQLRTFDHPDLKAVCEEVRPGDDLSFIQTMRQACREHNGIGLAAPQIGVLKRVIFIWHMQRGGEAIVMVNPVVFALGKGTYDQFEGCLSYPGFDCPVTRHDSIEVSWDDPESGEKLRRTFWGLQARVVQHEIHHIDGICLVGDAWRAQQAGGRNAKVY